MDKEKQITLNESLFSDLVVQVAILKEIYDKVESNKQMKFHEKKILLRNQKLNNEIYIKLEELCKDL